MFPPYFIAEFVAFICSLLLLVKGVDKKLRIFIIYCLVVLLNETINNLLVNYWHYSSNHKIENFAVLLFFSFYLISCFLSLLSPNRKKISIGLLAFFVISWIFNLFIELDADKFYIYSFISGCIFVSIGALLYMLELLGNKKIIYPLKTPFFYIAAGYLIYGIPLAIIFSIHTYFAYLKTPIESYRYYFVITLNTANVLMYIFLSISFLVAWSQRKLSK